MKAGNSVKLIALSVAAAFSVGCASDPRVVAAHYSAEQARFSAHAAVQKAVYENQHPLVELTAFNGKPIKIEAASLKVFAPIQGGGSLNQPILPTQQYVNPDAQAFASVVNTAMPFLGGMGLLWAGKSLVNAATAPLQQTATNGFNALSASSASTAAVGQAGIVGVTNTASQGFTAQSATAQAGLNATASTAQAGLATTAATAQTGMATTAAIAQAGLNATTDTAKLGIDGVQKVSAQAITSTTNLATQAISKIETVPVVVAPSGSEVLVPVPTSGGTVFGPAPSQ